MDRVVGGIAAGAGYLVRILLWLVGVAPEVAGPLFLFYGVWQMSHAWAWVVAGALMLAATWWQRLAPKGRRSR